MELSSEGAKQQDYIGAYTRMRKGLRIIFVSWVLIAVGFMVVLGSIFTSIVSPSFRRGHIGTITFEIPTSMVVLLVIVFVAAIIALVGLWKDFLPGVNMLASINPEFSTSRTLLKLGYFWGIILAIVSIPLFFVLVGIITFIISGILILLGHIGLIILAFKLKDFEGETLYFVAGILAILGIIFPILSAVALILLYIALGSSIAKRRGQLSLPAKL